MKITLICAMGENKEIGEDNKLLWDLPEDMNHFRSRTSGLPVIMGRKTYESIGMLLPKRRNIILTRNSDLKIEGAEIFTEISTLLDVLQQDAEELEVFVIGGATIYEQFLPYATHLSLTFVHQKFPNADAFFPEISDMKLQKISEKNFKKDEVYDSGLHDFDFDICEFEVVK